MVAELGGRLWMRRQKFFYVVLGDFFELVHWDLETAGDFIVLRNCTFAPQEGGKLALHLLADLYLMP